MKKHEIVILVIVVIVFLIEIEVVSKIDRFINERIAAPWAENHPRYEEPAALSEYDLEDGLLSAVGECREVIQIAWHWDSFYCLDDGSFVLKYGARRFVLDEKHDQLSGPGYHSIYRTAGGDLVGRKGACIYWFGDGPGSRSRYEAGERPCAHSVDELPERIG